MLAHPPGIALLGVALPAGSRVQLDGASGSGKTTLIERLIGLRPPQAGCARIDGVDPAFLPAELARRTFAWLPQDAAMLAGTVRDNLLLARPDACETALWQALHDAALDRTVRRLPDGLDTWIGADGARLSGGERRRLALARACLADAPWLLLDEPLEGLDHATAATIAGRLERRLDRTGQGLIVTSHHALPPTLAPRRISVARPIRPPFPAAATGG